MPRVPVIAIVCLFGGMALAAVGACDGDEPGSDFARSVSDAAYPLWLGVPAYYLLSGDGEKVETGRRVVDALALSAAATQLAKATINSRRPTPHEANKRGMPSGHAALTFAVAAAVSERDPDWKWPAFGTAALMSWSRYDLKQHYWDQIIVGAALGTYLGRVAGRGKTNIWADGQRSSVGLSLAPAVGSGAPAGPVATLIYRTSF
jgi:hypothetical protein